MQFNAELLLNFPKKEKFVLNSTGFQISRKTITNLQKQKDSNNVCLNQCGTYSNICPVMQKLICSTEMELNCDEIISDLNKVRIIIYINIQQKCYYYIGICSFFL